MLLKNVFSLKVTVFDPRNSSSHLLFLSDLLIYLFQKSTCNHSLLHVQCIRQMFSISGVLLFQRSVYSNRFWVDRQYFKRSLLVFFRIRCFFETSTCSHLYFQRNWLICHTSCSHPFLERPLFYCEIPVAAIHSFKFTAFSQNRSSSKEVS